VGQAPRIDHGPKIDDRAVQRLLEESRDVHADAMSRRGALAAMGCGLAGLAAGVLAAPARADTALDVQILQTASSLEALAVATYGIALGQGPDQVDAPSYKAIAALPVKSARDALTAFAMETMRQHAEHKKAFQAQTTALDRTARIQDAPNPKFLAVVRSAGVPTPSALVDVAALLEQVATDTYLANLTMVQDARSKAILAGVMGVEAQHLAILRMIDALLEGGATDLVAVALPAARMKDVPHAVGSVAFPEALHTLGAPELVAEPGSGALT
jgi:hypothetical protein